MLLRQYLDRKNVTFQEANDVPVYVMKYLRAQRRTRTVKPIVKADSPDTRGKTK